MPSRIIRESALTSETLDKLSDGAERLFWRLTLVADDHGRFHAHSRILLGHCFPLKVGILDLRKIEEWLLEMQAINLINMYKVNGKFYGYFPTWEKHQRIRFTKSKFPVPPQEEINSNSKEITLPQNAAICGKTPPRVWGIGYREEGIGSGVRGIAKGEDSALPTPLQTNQEVLNQNFKVKKRGTTFPDNFEVSAEILAWAKDKGIPDPHSEFEAFRDYHTSKGTILRDWSAGFRTWLRNAKRFKPSEKIQRTELQKSRPIAEILAEQSMFKNQEKDGNTA